MNQAKPRRGALRRWLDEPGVFLKWVVFACVIGIVVGGVSTAFYFCSVFC